MLEEKKNQAVQKATESNVDVLDGGWIPYQQRQGGFRRRISIRAAFILQIRKVAPNGA